MSLSPSPHARVPPEGASVCLGERQREREREREGRERMGRGIESKGARSGVMKAHDNKTYDTTP